MMKKAFYLIVITFILVAPIIFWLDIKWAMKLSSIDIKKLRFAFTRDKFLLIATSFNFILYGFVVYKIITMNEVQKKVDEKKTPVAKEEKSAVIPSSSTGNGVINPNDKKWQEMYKGDGKPLDNKVNENIKTDTNVIKEQVVNKIEEQTLNKTSEQPLHTTEVNEEKNIINIPVSSNEVYITQTERILSEMGYEIMGDLFIDGVDIDFIAIAGSDTLLIGKVQSSNNEIVANENTATPNTAPSWFSNDEKFNSPVWEIKKVKEEIFKMINEVLPADNGVMVKPIVVIPNSNIVNYADVDPKWKEMGVDVVKLNGNSMLPEITSVITDKRDEEVLESYKKFVETLIKYFAQKYKRKSMKKAG